MTPVEWCAMKTITEFSGLQFLKNAYQKLKEIQAAGKTPEELLTAMGETLQIEGEKLTHVMNALEAVHNKVDNLKRVIVFSLAEGEKAPPGSFQKEAFHYVSEFFPSLKSDRKPGREDRNFSKDGKRGGKGGKGGKDNRRGDKNKGRRGPAAGGEFRGKPSDSAARSAGVSSPNTGPNTGPNEGGVSKPGQLKVIINPGAHKTPGDRSGDGKNPRFKPRSRRPQRGSGGGTPKPAIKLADGSTPVSTGPRPVITPRSSVKSADAAASTTVAVAQVNPELQALRKEALEASQKPSAELNSTSAISGESAGSET